MTTRRDVRLTYERIGTHFSKTRASPWPEVESFLDGRSGDVGLDVGCGNGRHAALLAGRTERVVALDASRALLGEARSRDASLRLVQGDAARLPLSGGCVDLAVYVATLHHLPTAATRRESLAELGRVLSSGGRALVSAWSTTHERFDRATSFDTAVDWTLPDGTTVDRFYHVFSPAAFESLLDASPLAVERTFVSAGNCYGVVGPRGPDGDRESD
jgi:ubiquinone/menaquinone biosynthesis C-methylase UbiE